MIYLPDEAHSPYHEKTNMLQKLPKGEMLTTIWTKALLWILRKGFFFLLPLAKYCHLQRKCLFLQFQFP